jgi:nucleotide-binding universal stress UspA family protein
MINTVVVPLDGSQLAERALEPASRIAHRLRARLHLVHVYEPQIPSILVSGAPVLDPQLDRDLRAEALAYLERIATREERGGEVRVTFAVVDGPVVKSLAEHVAALDGALVVMTTHGRTGLERVMLGSVTDGLVRSTTVPVLTIRVLGGELPALPPGEFGRVLIPLEGPYFGVQVVDLAVELAGTDGPEYVLLSAVSPVPIIPPPEPPIPVPVMDLEAQEEAANHFLATLAGPLQARGVRAFTKVVIDPDPARAILAFVNDEGIDLICMATHGYHGLKRLLFGSVAEKVLRSAQVPVLLVRPRETAESSNSSAKGQAAASRS